MNSPRDLSYCAHEVYRLDRPRFLQSLFVPEGSRRGLLALCALDLELRRIPSLVSEEMIGHIRYAWWREALEGLYQGAARGGQPVLEELQRIAAHVPQERLLALVDAYAAPYPQAPTGAQEALDNAAAAFLGAAAPQALAAWEKAGGILRRHYRRYKTRLQPWLTFKLLLAGL